MVSQVKHSRRKRRGKKLKKKAKPTISSSGEPRPVPGCTAMVQSEYKAGEFDQARKDFIHQYVADARSKGVKLAKGQAQDVWSNSLKRAQLLAGVSLGELKRRKFVSKSCLENPFRARVERETG